MTSLSFTIVSGWTLNGIWSFLRPCLEVHLYKRDASGRVTLLPETELSLSASINVNKTRKPFQKHSWRTMFPQCFKLCLHDRAGNFNENPSIRAVAKFLRAGTSEHSSNFCEQFEQRPNFASTFKLDRTILYPYESQTQTLCRFPKILPLSAISLSAFI